MVDQSVDVSTVTDFDAGTNGSTTAMPNLGPSLLLTQLHIGVIGAVTGVVAIVFIAVYIQLVLVLCYGYKLFSYQTVFLFNILLWATLRLTLYSFYFYHCCELVNNLPVVAEWILVSAPSILLFLSLALLVHYFMENLVKVVERRQELFYLNPSYKKIHMCRLAGTTLWITSLVLFVTVNIVLSIFIYIPNYNDDNMKSSLRIPRVVILESLLFLMGLALGIFIIVSTLCSILWYGRLSLIYTTRAGKDIMEAKQVSKPQAIVISSLLILLFSSRALYNIIAVAVQAAHLNPYGYSKTIATDMADFDSNNKKGDIVYFCVLLLWEVIPICLIVLFFRIRSPSTLKLLQCNTEQSLLHEHSRHFFDTYTNSNSSRSRNGRNGRNTSSSLLRSSQVSIPSLPSHIYPSKAGYGSTNSRHLYSAPTKYSINGGYTQSSMPGTTPPQLFTGSPTVFSDTQTINN